MRIDDDLDTQLADPEFAREYVRTLGEELDARASRLAAMLPIVTWVAEMDYRQAERAEMRYRARALLAEQGEAQHDA